MADGENPEVVAENVTVITGEANAAIEAAEERAENAEAVAEAITDAAIHAEHGRQIEALAEETAECQTETEQAQSLAEDAHRRMAALETNQASTAERLGALTVWMEEILTRLRAQTPPPSNPTPEATPATEAEPTPDPGADAPPEAAPAARRKGLFRLM